MLSAFHFIIIIIIIIIIYCTLHKSMYIDIESVRYYKRIDKICMQICITQKQSDTYRVSPVTMYQKIVTNNFVTFTCNNIQHKQTDDM
jgi:hypothetical protein